MIRHALESLAAESVAFTTRGKQPIDDPPPSGDVDILVGARDLASADRILKQAGFHHQKAPGHRGHRFYLAFDGEHARWLKIDINVVPRRRGWDLSARDEASLRRFSQYRIGAKGNPGLLERIWSAASWRRPVSWRRLGPVIAFLGPDGAGKGTLIARLAEQVPMATTAMYLGLGNGSRGEYRSRSRPSRWPAQATRRSKMSAPRAAVPSAARGLLPVALIDAQHRVRQTLRFVIMVAPAYLVAWRGHLVVCDRHPIEHLAIGQPGPRPVLAFERIVSRYVIPRPDVLVILDAPAEVMFARKGEQSVPVLQAWRQRYQQAFAPLGARIVSTDRPLDDTVKEVAEIAWDAVAARRAW